MKSPEYYERIIKKLIVSNWQSWPYFENEDDEKPSHYKYVIYMSPGRIFIFNGKPEDSLADVLSYLFKKVMEVS